MSTDYALPFSLVPEEPIDETLEWSTDVITTKNGTEQRVCLRGSPRRSLSARYLVTDRAQIQKFRDAIKSLVAQQVKIPYFQYGSRVSQSAAFGTSDLAFDVSTTDLRLSEDLLILDPDGTAQIGQISAINSNGVTLSEPLIRAVSIGAIVAPVFPSYIDDRRSVVMGSANNVARIDLSSFAAQPRVSVSRLPSLATVTTLDYLPVLEKRPIVNGDVKEVISSDVQIVDFGQTVSEFYSLAFAREEFDREYKINRLDDPELMDWWRDFLQAVKGSCKPFWLPSFRPDLTLVERPADSFGSIVVAGTEYASTWWTEPCRRLYLHTDAGPLPISVGGVHTDNGNSVLTGITTGSSAQGGNPVPSGEGWRDINEINFMSRCRLKSDSVTFSHSSRITTLGLTMRTVG